jgi:hypothetical protein
MGRNFGMIAFEFASERNTSPAQYAKFRGQVVSGEILSPKTRQNDSIVRAATAALFKRRNLETVCCVRMRRT